MGPRITAALAAVLAVACASAPPEELRAECPAPGPRAAPRSAFAGAGDAKNGEFLFGAVCLHCHAGASPQRKPEAGSAPRLDCPDWLAATSDAFLYDAINRGPGSYGHGPLPPLGERLTPAQIADLVAYLRSLAAR
jgi:mono/diheme cytochrome c family protein